MRFDDYRKDLRYYYDTLYTYYPSEVEKNFYRCLDALGAFNKMDRVVFITIRLKGNSDWITCNGVIDGLSKKISRFYWGRKSKYQLLPFVGAIESVQRTRKVKDHIHMMVRMTEPKQYYTDNEICDIVKSIAYDLEEVNKRDTGSVEVSIFPFFDNTREQGNKVEYMCKTSSKHYTPIVLKPFTLKQIQKQVKTKL